VSRTWRNKAASIGSAVFQYYSDHALKRRFRAARNFRGKFTCSKRGQDQTYLLLIVAGHKPGLWPLVFPRVLRFVPKTWDVCICAPGADSLKLRRIAEENDWSYLHTTDNQLAAAQNLAIQEHPSASLIAKMDEDIFLVAGCLDGLAEAFSQAEDSLGLRPGIVAPLINVNGYCARIILNKQDRLKEFEDKFGRCWQSCTETPVWKAPGAAQFLWEATSPLDEIAANWYRSGIAFSTCAQRFSIGCFAIQRDFWSAMQGFTVAPAGDLGVEEIDLSTHCVATSRPIVVAEHLLVGHAGFGGQMSVLEPWLLENATTLGI
jgi:hypothetical protein